MLTLQFPDPLELQSPSSAGVPLDALVLSILLLMLGAGRKWASSSPESRSGAMDIEAPSLLSDRSTENLFFFFSFDTPGYTRLQFQHGSHHIASSDHSGGKKGRAHFCHPGWGDNWSAHS